MDHDSRRHSTGFTLIELMVAVAIMAILSAIAIGAYEKTVRSSRLTEAFAILGESRQQMEQLKQNTRRYSDPLNANACGFTPQPNKYFDFVCTTTAMGKQFTATASNKAGVGLGGAAEYSYSIDQAGVKNTVTFAGVAGPSGVWKNK